MDPAHDPSQFQLIEDEPVDSGRNSLSPVPRSDTAGQHAAEHPYHADVSQAEGSSAGRASASTRPIDTDPLGGEAERPAGHVPSNHQSSVYPLGSPGPAQPLDVPPPWSSESLFARFWKKGTGPDIAEPKDDVEMPRQRSQSEGPSLDRTGRTAPCGDSRSRSTTVSASGTVIAFAADAIPTQGRDLGPDDGLSEVQPTPRGDNLEKSTETPQRPETASECSTHHEREDSMTGDPGREMQTHSGRPDDQQTPGSSTLETAPKLRKRTSTAAQQPDELSSNILIKVVRDKKTVRTLSNSRNEAYAEALKHLGRSTSVHGQPGVDGPDLRAASTLVGDGPSSPGPFPDDQEPLEPPSNPLGTRSGSGPAALTGNAVDDTEGFTFDEDDDRSWLSWVDEEGHWLHVSHPTQATLDAESKATLPFAAETRHWNSMVGNMQSPYTAVSMDEWELLAKPLRDRAIASWGRLGKLMECYEDIIIDVWRGEPGAEEMKGREGQKKRKLIRQLRRDLIEVHWPCMAPARRPDLLLLRQRKPTDGLLPDPRPQNDLSAEDLTAKRKREAVLWPHMNAEYLVDRWWYLVQMLQSRSRHGMQQFAAQDMPPGRRCFLELFVRFIYVPDSVMTTHPTRGLYGHLYSIDFTGRGFAMLEDHLLTTPGEGLLLLEVQDRLYGFLADMADAMARTRPQITPAPGLGKNRRWQLEDRRLISGTAGNAPLIWAADVRDEAPYSGSKARSFSPDRSVDLRRQHNLLLCIAKQNEAVDHWYFLRNDLGYFREMVTLWRDHRLQLLADEHGAVDPSPPESVWADAIADCVTNAYQKMIYWDEAYRRIEFVSCGTLTARPMFAGDSDLLVGEVDPATGRRSRSRPFLYSFLTQWEGPSILLLRALLSFSPDMRPYHRRRTPGARESLVDTSLQSVDAESDWRCDQASEYEPAPKANKKPKNGKRGAAEEATCEVGKKRQSWEYFEWLINSLFDCKVRRVLGLQTILDELDNLLISSPQAMRSAPPESRMLSDLVYTQLSDMATHSELFDSEFVSEMDTKYELLRVSEEELSFLVQEEEKFECRWKGGLPTSMDKPGGDAIVARSKDSKGAGTFQGSPTMWSSGYVAISRLLDKDVEGAEKAFRNFWDTFGKEVKAQGVWQRPVGGESMVDFGAPPKRYSDEVLQRYVTGRRRVSGDMNKSSQSLSETSGPSPCADEDEDSLDSDLSDDDEEEDNSPVGGCRHKLLEIRLDVDDRALKVFKTMLVPAKEGWEPAPVLWGDFVHALLQADFKLFFRYGRELLAVPPDGLYRPAHIFRQPRHGKRGHMLSVAKLYRYGQRLVRTANGKLGYSQFSRREVQCERERDATDTEQTDNGGHNGEDGNTPLYWLGSGYWPLEVARAKTLPGTPRQEWPLLF